MIRGIKNIIYLNGYFKMVDEQASAEEITYYRLGSPLFSIYHDLLNGYYFSFVPSGEENLMIRDERTQVESQQLWNHCYPLCKEYPLYLKEKN